jgi:hypothetical protein
MTYYRLYTPPGETEPQLIAYCVMRCFGIDKTKWKAESIPMTKNQALSWLALCKSVNPKQAENYCIVEFKVTKEHENKLGVFEEYVDIKKYEE